RPPPTSPLYPYTTLFRSRFPALSQLSQVGQLTPRDVQERLSSPAPPLLVDVRQPDEYSGELGHIAGSRSIPLRELAARVEEISRSEEHTSELQSPYDLVC